MLLLFATGVNDTGGKFAAGDVDTGGASGVVDTGGKFAASGRNWWQNLQRHRWYTLTWEYLREFSKKFEMILMLLSGA